MRPTFHLIPVAEWESSDPGSALVRDSLADEGFVHCTDGLDALMATAQRHYRDDPRGFLALTIDLELVSSPWRYDEPGTPYPHIYGPIDRVAIVRCDAVKRGPDGAYLGLVER